MRRKITAITSIAAAAMIAVAPASAQVGGADASAWLALSPKDKAIVARTTVEHVAPNLGRMQTGIKAYGLMKCMDSALGGSGASAVAKQKLTTLLVLCWATMSS